MENSPVKSRRETKAMLETRLKAEHARHLKEIEVKAEWCVLVVRIVLALISTFFLFSFLYSKMHAPFFVFMVACVTGVGSFIPLQVRCFQNTAHRFVHERKVSKETREKARNPISIVETAH